MDGRDGGSRRRGRRARAASPLTQPMPDTALPRRPWAVKTSSPIRRSCPEFTSEAVFAATPTERVGREKRRAANLCGLVFTNRGAAFPDF